MPVRSFSHIGICVSNLERSRQFYEELLGFDFASELEFAGEPSATLLAIPDVKFKAVYLQREGVRIELLHYATPGHQHGDAPRPMNRLGLTHLSLRVDGLEALLERLRAAGVRVLDASNIYNAELAAGAIMITDPDGTRIELYESRGDPLSGS